MKIKVKIKDYRLVVKVKPSFGEKIDENKAVSFADLDISGFLRPQVIKKNAIEYTGPIGISLLERLKRPVTKRDFFFIMEQIVVMAQKLNYNSLVEDCLLLDMQSVFINENTKELQFIYFPLQTKKSGKKILEFMGMITSTVELEEEKDMEYVSRFSFFLNKMEKFHAEAVERYIAKEDKIVVDIIKRQNVANSELIADNASKRIKPSDGDEETGLLMEEDEYGEIETGLLMEEDEYGETGFLDESEEHIFAKLYRVKTDEDIEINTSPFRLGRDSERVQYFIDNKDVSRKHAEIIRQGSRYYIIDANSKNSTFVNGKKIDSGYETELYEEDRILLANEEFIFYQR